MQDYILEMREITKEFPGVKALDKVSFQVKRGEIKAGKQSMTAFLDANELVKIIVPVTTSLLNGEVPAATATYNNETIDVPAQTYSPYAITAENVNYLVEVGFYTEADING